MPNDPLPFEPRRFEKAATHYLKGRPGYPDRLIRRVVEATGLQPVHRLMDLGCGPGQLAVAFAPYVHEVLGVDPEPAMLAAAQSQAGLSNVSWLEASSYSIGAELGRFRMVTMGHSFHWMDREDTLRRLDGIVEPAGAIVLFHHLYPDLPQNHWRRSLADIVRRHRPARTGGSVRRQLTPHATVLLNSAFCRLDEISIDEQQQSDAGALLDRVLSSSATANGLTMDRARALEADIVALAKRLGTNGVVTEAVTISATIARRS